jgi:AraC-like DNA-binding protein
MKTATQEVAPVVFQHRVPGEPLSRFVGLFWYWRGHPVLSSKERILPGGTSELVINLGSGTTTGARISGPQSKSVIIERTSDDELIGIHFRHGGLFPFINFPFGELHGLNLTLTDIWEQPEADRLVCRLHEAPAVEAKFGVLERWLTAVACRPLEHHRAVAFAIRRFQRNPNFQSSESAAKEVNLSQRRFIELFRDQVGLTPKLFCRVQRFQDVIAGVRGIKEVDWADVALSCGYFDQSHFNHDFREFSGLTPTEYLFLRTEHLSHVQFPG